MYTEQSLKCADCGTEFPFSAAEQQFYAEKGFQPPKRCRSCRQAAKAGGGSQGRSGGARPGGPGGRTGDRPMYDAQCAACGVQTQVPFQPSGAKPVYCRDCFRRA
jgi:CxxC-x17-CxxC domain-containing protein